MLNFRKNFETYSGLQEYTFLCLDTEGNRLLTSYMLLTPEAAETEAERRRSIGFARVLFCPTERIAKEHV